MFMDMSFNFELNVAQSFQKMIDVTVFFLSPFYKTPLIKDHPPYQARFQIVNSIIGYPPPHSS